MFVNFITAYGGISSFFAFMGVFGPFFSLIVYFWLFSYMSLNG